MLKISNFDISASKENNFRRRKVQKYLPKKNKIKSILIYGCPAR